MSEIDDLITDIEQYCERNGIKETTFGFRCVNDGKLVSRLRKGKTLTLPTLRQIEKYIASTPVTNEQVSQ